MTPVTRCQRSGCGRPLTAAESVARGFSKACAVKEALRLAVELWSPAQRAKAEEAVIAGKLRPTSREGMYHVTSSDGVTVYLTSVHGCPCQARGLCWHQAAAALADAYRKVA